jgi:hypothetical protein
MGRLCCAWSEALTGCNVTIIQNKVAIPLATPPTPHPILCETIPPTRRQASVLHATGQTLVAFAAKGPARSRTICRAAPPSLASRASFRRVACKRPIGARPRQRGDGICSVHRASITIARIVATNASACSTTRFASSASIESPR